ncbi:MAG: LacI family DNA-binding transcriptional regulator [Micromonosporaceae bacterium]
MPRSRPTARDVAALAGVSIATVSYVLNGRSEGRVSQATIHRVLAAARQLAYAPNGSARNLRRRRTERVCLVVGAVGVPANDHLTRDLHTVADETGHGVITIMVDSDVRAQQAVELLRQRIADGTIIAPAVPHIDDSALQSLARSHLPLVVMSDTATPAGFDVVQTRTQQACGEALDHLFESGRRRIAFIAHDMDLRPGGPTGRLTAYQDALARHDIDPGHGIVVTGSDDRVAAHRATLDLMARDDPPDAIFAASDRAALSVLWALHQRGVAVPDDVAVIGVGNLEEGLISTPQLTTVGDPAQDYRPTARLLFDRLLADEPVPDRHITAPWALIRRGSA